MIFIINVYLQCFAFTVSRRLEGFQIYIGDLMPSVGSPPPGLQGAKLCYTHTETITMGGLTYTVPCDQTGSVVSVFLPHDVPEVLSVCEVQVYSRQSKYTL